MLALGRVAALFRVRYSGSKKMYGSEAGAPFQAINVRAAIARATFENMNLHGAEARAALEAINVHGAIARATC